MFAVSGLIVGMVTAPADAAVRHAAPADSGKHAVPGDFDGDGRSDLAIGVPGTNTVRVSYTHAKPHGSSTVNLKPGAQAKKNMNFGTTLATGDVNGDGYADLAVAAPQFTNKKYVGAVFVFEGSAAGLRPTPQVIVDRTPKDSDIDSVNELAETIGDANGDKYADLVTASSAGVFVFHGSAHGVHAADKTKVNVSDGESVALADVNGDGHPELVVGRSIGGIKNHGDVYGEIDIFKGKAHGLGTTRHDIVGNQVGEASFPYEGFGSTIVAGDFNGDGYADIAAGVPGGKQSGADKHPGNVLALFGGPHGLSKDDVQRFDEHMAYSGSSDDDSFGTTIAAGDITGDGYTDLVVDAPDVKVDGHPSAGAVYLVHGSPDGLTATDDQRFTQSSTGIPGTAAKDDAFGTALYVGDFTGGAHLDVAIGTPLHKSWKGYVVGLRGTANGVTTAGATSVASQAKNAMFGSAIG
jgi:hypothetical protein